MTSLGQTGHRGNSSCDFAHVVRILSREGMRRHFSIVTGLKSVPFMEGVGSRIFMYGAGPPETCSAAVMHGVSVVAIWRIVLVAK